MKPRFFVQCIFISIPFFMLFSCISLSDEVKTSINKAVINSIRGISGNVKAESRVAVLDIKEVRGVEGRQKKSGRSEYVLDILTKRLVDTNKFLTVDKTGLATIKGGRNFQTMESIPDEQAIAAGKLLGADVVVTGVITGSSGADYLRIKAIDVRSGRILSMTYEDIKALRH